MKLFDITFPLEELPASRQLYYRSAKISTSRDERGNGFLHFFKNDEVSFDTYFNSFPVSAYKKYTPIKQLTIVFELKGEFEVSIHCQRQHKEAGYQSTDCLYTAYVNSEEPTTWSCTIDIQNESPEVKSIIFPMVTAKGNDSIIHSGYYATDGIPENSVNLAVNICTFKREPYIIKNVERLISTVLADNSPVRDNMSVYIIDNGNTLKGQLPEHEKIILEYNKNYGGSGGFTRGLIEAYHAGNFTHVLMMDDDIILDTAVLERLIGFLRIQTPTEKALHVSGAMLDIDYPTYQIEAGAMWDGVLHSLHRFDMQSPQNLLTNSANDYADYGAWWFMCMPISVIEKNGLPYPFFIRGDDVEYGLRNIDICLTMNGIAVWHESFEKKRSLHMDYFMFRNELIINTIYQYNTKTTSALYFLSRVLKNLSIQRYSVAELYIMALSDYLKGVDYFVTQEEDKRLMDLLAKNPKFLDSDALLESGVRFQKQQYDAAQTPNATKMSKLFRLLTFNGLLIPTCFYHDEIGYMDVDDLKPINACRRKTMLHWHPALKKGFITQLDKKRCWKLLFKVILLTASYLLKKDAVALDYRENHEKITNMEYWERHLGLMEGDISLGQSKV